MKHLKRIMIIALLLTLTACAGEGNSTSTETAPSTEVDMKEEITMIARVTELGDRLTVEVTESPYTSGVHWVITPSETVYIEKDGSAIKREEIKIGDTVEILYNGQVMMSYPPQIVAKQIKVI